MKRTVALGCLSLATALGAGVVTASPGIAAAPSQSCPHLTGSATISPGLSTTPKNNTASATGSLTACTPAATTGGTGANAQLATISGKVASGLFAGKRITGAVKFTVRAGQNCSVGHPIRNITFTNTKPFQIIT